MIWPSRGVVGGAHPLPAAAGAGGGDLAPDDLAHEVVAEGAGHADQVSGDGLHPVATVLGGAQVLVADVHRRPAAGVQHPEALPQHLPEVTQVLLIRLLVADLAGVSVVLETPIGWGGDDKVNGGVVQLGQVAAVGEVEAVVRHGGSHIRKCLPHSGGRHSA